MFGIFLQRQTQRCIEIHLLRQLNKRDMQEYRQYRLHVKERLYKFNAVCASCILLIFISYFIFLSSLEDLKSKV